MWHATWKPILLLGLSPKEITRHQGAKGKPTELMAAVNDASCWELLNMGRELAWGPASARGGTAR